MDGIWHSFEHLFPLFSMQVHTLASRRLVRLAKIISACQLSRKPAVLRHLLSGLVYLASVPSKHYLSNTCAIIIKWRHTEMWLVCGSLKTKIFDVIKWHILELIRWHLINDWTRPSELLLELFYPNKCFFFSFLFSFPSVELTAMNRKGHMP